MHLQAKGRSGGDTSKPSCCTRRPYIFRMFFRYNCLLHISINYAENVTDLYAHAQTVDTRRSSPIFQAPGYEANAEPTLPARPHSAGGRSGGAPAHKHMRNQPCWLDRTRQVAGQGGAATHMHVANPADETTLKVRI